MTIAVITGDIPPVGGLAANGAGLRAWGLAAALRELGHDAHLWFPAEHEPHAPMPPWVRAVPRRALCEAARGAGEDGPPRALIFQHWGLLAEGLGSCGGRRAPGAPPVAIDLAGPHLLERAYWGHPDGAASFDQKRRALAAAEAVFIANRRQAAWFAPFLAEAWGGEDVALEAMARGGWWRSAATSSSPPGAASGAPAAGSEGGAVPGSGSSVRTVGRAGFFFGAPPEFPLLPEVPPRSRPLIVVSGAFLPWQDARWAIEETLAFLDEIGRGELLVIGSELPFVGGGEAIATLLRLIGRHPRARRLGRLPFEAVAAHLAVADATLDLMAPNPERLLASPTRTAVARWLGVPVLYNDYDEEAEEFRRAGGAGCAPPATLIGARDAAGLRWALERVAERADPTEHAASGGGARGASGGEASGRGPARGAEVLRPRVLEDAQRAAGDVAAWIEAIAARAPGPALSIASSAPVGSVFDLEQRRAIAARVAELLELPIDARTALHDGLALVEERLAAQEAGAAPDGRPRAGRPPSSLRRLGRTLLSRAATPFAAAGAFVAALVVASRSRE